MWLWPELMRMLRPKILDEARPGTRVVTRIWDLGPAWKPDATDTSDASYTIVVGPSPLAIVTGALPSVRATQAYGATLQASGVRLHYEEAGRGRALCLIHAFPVGRRMWAPQVPAFARRFRPAYSGRFLQWAIRDLNSPLGPRVVGDLRTASEDDIAFVLTRFQ